MVVVEQSVELQMYKIISPKLQPQAEILMNHKNRKGQGMRNTPDRRPYFSNNKHNRKVISPKSYHHKCI